MAKRFFGAALMIIFLTTGACSKQQEAANSSVETYSLSLDFTRIDQIGYSPFKVSATLKNQSGTAIAGKTLTLNVPNGAVSSVTDNGDGTYEFTVTPSASGTYPVQVSYQTASITRKALVYNTANLGTGVGQALEVPGDYVNTEGYEDGITATPDGNYLFVQYGPIYFSGLFLVSSICASGSYSLYDLLGCGPKPDSNWVFNTIGPYGNYQRPRFPTGGITAGGNLGHINITIPGLANGIALFPTVFYGFKRQADGTFAEPFKVAFNDARGAQAPYGLSFQMVDATMANFVVAWSNYFNDIAGDGKLPKVYQGTLTMGQDKNLGDVAYAGETFSSITPNISPMPFGVDSGVQGNPHLYYDTNGIVKSIWIDDEQTTHDLYVYTIASGAFPTGTWTKVTLPSTINTAGSESQPFFTGTRLYLTRDTKIVYHDYLGSGGADYALNASWGPEHVLLSTVDTSIGSIVAFGEPTIAKIGTKTFLYFAAVKSRAAGTVMGRRDMNIDAGFVELQ